MKKTLRIGFVPAHRDPFSEDWAVQMRERILKALDSLFAGRNIEVVVPDESITPKGLVRDDDDAKKVVDLFQKKEIDGIIIGAVTFGDEISAITVAEWLQPLPVLLFSTKEGPFTEDGCRLSDAFCGTLSIASGLYRRKIPFALAGNLFPEEEVFSRQVEDFLRTCSAVRGFLGARVGMVGPRPERFETCSINEYPLIEQFGQRIVQISLSDIFQQANTLKNTSKINELIKEMKSTVDASGVREQTLEKAARLEIVLQNFARSKNLDALAIQCWTAMQEIYGISSCFTMARLTEQGLMSACEVDVHGALTMLIQYLASLEQTPPHFIDWTIQHQSKDNVFLAWHCGNAPPVLRAKDSPVCLRSHSILGEQVGREKAEGTAEFQLKPGVVTLNRLVEYDGCFKLLITTGKIIPSTDKLRGSWSWVEVKDLERLYRTLIEEGFTHHASMIHGDFTSCLTQFCQSTGIEAVVV